MIPGNYPAILLQRLARTRVGLPAEPFLEGDEGLPIESVLPGDSSVDIKAYSIVTVQIMK